MMKDAHARKFDVLCCWKIDRLSRSLSHLLGVLDTLRSLDIDFVSITQEQFDTTTAAGRLMLSVVGAFSEFERSLIQERVKAGMALAKSRGVLPGPKPQAINLNEVGRRQTQGEGLRAIAKDLGVSASMLSKRMGKEGYRNAIVI